MDQPTDGWRIQFDRNSPLDSAAMRGELTREEYLGADSWRKTHQLYLNYLFDTDRFSDDAAKTIEKNYRLGVEILTGGGNHRRIFHAVCAICTYGEPDELGDPAYTLETAKAGFRALARGLQLEPVRGGIGERQTIPIARSLRKPSLSNYDREF
jgi:hypothetical protein